MGTAYSNSNLREIKEEIYPAKIKAEDLIQACESLDDDTVEAMTKRYDWNWIFYMVRAESIALKITV